MRELVLPLQFVVFEAPNEQHLAFRQTRVCGACVHV